MSEYSVIATVDLFPGVSGGVGYPYGNPANAILSDGTFCIAIWVENYPSNETLRVYRLATDLTVLGYTDIDTGFTRAWPTPYLVALPGNKVFMVSRLHYGYPRTKENQSWATWIVDCSGGTPAVGPIQNMASSLWPAYDYGGIFHVLDLANDRIVLASPHHDYPNSALVQAFRASTGALLSEAKADGEYRPVGLYMDPNNPTSFRVPTKWNGVTHGFTVATDGSSVTWDGIFLRPVASPDWIMAGGDPFLANGGGFITAQTHGSPPPSYSRLEYWDYAGTVVMAQIDRPIADSPNWDGDAACLGNGRYLVHVYEEYDGSAYPYSNHGLFVGVDQLSNPPAMEVIELPYYGIPTPQYRGTTAFWEQAAIVSADDASGVILVTMTTFTETTNSPYVTYYNLFIWVIQGPAAEKPNLNGGPIGVDVRFVT